MFKKTLTGYIDGYANKPFTFIQGRKYSILREDGKFTAVETGIFERYDDYWIFLRSKSGIKTINMDLIIDAREEEE